MMRLSVDLGSEAVNVSQNVFALSPDSDEVLVGTLRILRQARLMVSPEARAVWEPALVAALDILEPKERAACVTLAGDIAAIVRTASGGAARSES